MPDDFQPCLCHFHSPLQRLVLPREVANELRATGVNVPGSVSVGHSPGMFAFPDPNAPLAGLVLSDATWGKKAKLRVCFLNGGTGRKEQVEAFAKQWAEPAAIDFEWGAPKSRSDIRITFTGTGFYSRLGMEARQFPQETMSLGFRGHEPEHEVRRLVLHEFGHALGLFHEQQHPESGIQWDEAGALAVYRPLLPGLSDQAILEQLRAIPSNSFRFKVFPFDVRSIMMYSIPQRALKPGTWRPEFGNNNTTLSASDKEVIGIVYGKRNPVVDDRGPRKLEVDGLPLADGIETDGEVDLYHFTAPSDGRYEIDVTGTALVHVDITDKDGNPPYASDRGGDTVTPSVGLTMLRFLEKGRQNIRLTGSRYASGFSRGDYVISVRRVS